MRPAVFPVSDTNFGNTSAKRIYGVNFLLDLSRMYNVPLWSTTTKREAARGAFAGSERIQFTRPNCTLKLIAVEFAPPCVGVESGKLAKSSSTTAVPSLLSCAASGYVY